MGFFTLSGFLEDVFPASCTCVLLWTNLLVPLGGVSAHTALSGCLHTGRVALQPTVRPEFSHQEENPIAPSW